MTTLLSWLSDPARFSLRCPAEEVLDELCRSSWGWTNCSRCQNLGLCADISCPWKLRSALKSYRQFYLDVTFRYTSDDWDESLPALKSHGDLFEAVRLIQGKPGFSKRRLISTYFEDRDSHINLTDASKRRVFDLALHTQAMLPCEDWNPFQDRHITYVPETWRDDETACELVERAQPIGRPLDREEVRKIAQKVSAEKLRRCGMEITGTDDIRQHLCVDTKGRVVYIFHHSGFLKANLKAQVFRSATQG